MPRPRPHERHRSVKSYRGRYDRLGAGPAGLGLRLPGRGLVLPPRPAVPPRLGGGRRTTPARRALRRSRRPRAEGARPLRPWLPGPERMLLRFVAGRPVSGITRAFLAWVADRPAAEGVRVLALVWDNAPWHVSREVRAWIAAHNRRVKAVGRGCRLLVCHLPSKSPWLNPIEPRWAHGKRAVVEPDRKLAGQELRQRLCDHYRCPLVVEPLAQQLP